jgi:hypothetical protein
MRVLLLPAVVAMLSKRKTCTVVGVISDIAWNLSNRKGKDSFTKATNTNLYTIIMLRYWYTIPIVIVNGKMPT